MTRKVFTAELVIDQSYTSREAANRLGIGLTTFEYWLKQHRKRNGSAAAAEE